MNGCGTTWQPWLNVRRGRVSGQARCLLLPDGRGSDRGPTGTVIRTDEKLNNDATDNEHHFYLPDAHGGNVAMLVYPYGGGDREPGFQQFDAFGNAMTSRLTDAGMYAWRGGEGSETEILNQGAGQAAGQDWPNLTLMQARHYDPELGRFMQIDPLKMSSFTTQGLNRYIYCNNDPVNYTDPTGFFGFGGLLTVLTILAVIALLVDIVRLIDALACWLTGSESLFPDWLRFDFNNPWEVIRAIFTAAVVLAVVVSAVAILAGALAFAEVAAFAAIGFSIGYLFVRAAETIFSYNNLRRIPSPNERDGPVGREGIRLCWCTECTAGDRPKRDSWRPNQSLTYVA